VHQTPPPAAAIEPGAQAPPRPRAWLRTAAVLLVAVALGILLRLFVYESAVVVGESMEPTLRSGEYLLACKRACAPNSPRRGDIVTFRAPGAGRAVAIKRIIGLPGDWVQVWGTYIMVNGKRLEEPYARGAAGRAYPLIFVPPGSIYVLGDNRDNSEDSRIWGPVPIGSVRGTVVFAYYPLSRAGLVR
jgi:signal peptidase I